MSAKASPNFIFSINPRHPFKIISIKNPVENPLDFKPKALVLLV
jgi:hypothetical protein